MKLLALIGLALIGLTFGACALTQEQAADTAALSHPWRDTAADGGLNAGPAPGESSSIGSDAAGD